MLRQGMRAQDIAEKLFLGNAKSMRNDNIPKALMVLRQLTLVKNNS